MNFVIENSKILAFENDKKIGFLSLEINNEELTLLSTVVYPEARGKGVAKLLNEEVFKYAKTLNIKKIKIICSYSQKYFLQNKNQYLDFEIVLINSGEKDGCYIQSVFNIFSKKDEDLFISEKDAEIMEETNFYINLIKKTVSAIKKIFIK